MGRSEYTFALSVEVYEVDSSGDPPWAARPAGPPRLNPAALHDARDWLEFHTRFWTERLDALGDLVETGADEEGERR